MRIFIAIALCSASAISFEIVLTRIFSISLWYHFAFMVISIGMLGIGLSGTLQSIYPGLKRESNLGLYALLLSASIPLSHVLTNLVPLDPVNLQWDKIQMLYVALYYILLSVPFLFFGLVVATSFSAFTDRSGLVYGADLLGAGAGALGVILLMNTTSPEETVLYISFSALAAAFLMGKRLISVALALALALTLFIEPDIMHIRMSPYKELRQALGYPGAEHIKTHEDGYSRMDVFRSPAVRYAPGLSLNWLDPLPPQIGFTTDGSGTSAITDAGGQLEFLKHLPPALPYEIQKREKALVVDPKGGLQVLLSREYGVKNILKMESDPLLIDIIRNNYGNFSGNIYDSGTYTGLARNRLRQARPAPTALFDVIDISLTGAIPSGPFGISEDYRFTREAFREYLSHLSKDGVLSISLFILPPPRTELRLLLTAIGALEDMGISDAKGHIAAIRSWGSILMLIKPTPFSALEIEKTRKFAAQNGFDLVYHPGIREDETNIFVKTPSNDYHRAFASLIEADSREDFMKNYVFDIREVGDDRPYFHYYLKLSKLNAIYEVMGRKWQYFIQEGYLLPIVFLQAAVLSLLLLLLPGILKRGGAKPTFDLVYFALLGLGFMFVEVPLIQKMILPFENPQRAVALVLSAVLMSSGAGSLMSQRYRMLQSPGVLLVLALVSAVYAMSLSAAAGLLSSWHMNARLPLSFLVMMPAGFLMGIPFPMGMRALGRRNHALIPWAWAVNGCFSVLAPVLAVMLAMAWGFSLVFLLGAAMYGLAFVVGSRTLFENQESAITD
jgi:hypothetical protein